MPTKTEIQKQLQYYTGRLSDVRFVSQGLFVVIVLLVSWSGVKTIQTNYGLQKQISVLRQQNVLLQMENNNIDLQNQYFDSNQYLELSARQNFGLASPGEKEVVVPKAVAEAYTVNLPDYTNAKSLHEQSAYQRHFQSWIDFFMHHQDAVH